MVFIDCLPVIEFMFKITVNQRKPLNHAWSPEAHVFLMTEKIQNRMLDIHIGFVVVFCVMIFGCSYTVNYTVDPIGEFSGLKTYDWKLDPKVKNNKNLITENIKFLADVQLESKGLEKLSDNPDMFIVLFYENRGLERFERHQYHVTTLNFDLLRSRNEELIWRGTASGRINAGSASHQLKKVIKKIFKHFPL